MPFILVALAMTLAALALVVWPMLRSGKRQGRPRHVLVVALAIVFTLPLAALGLYLHVGTPAGLDAAAYERPTTPGQMIDQLRARLAAKPSAQGWGLLGRIYTAQGQLAQAREAYGEALKLAPDNTDLMVSWAETDAMARSDHYIGDRARSLLQQAVQVEPRSQRGLWLLGISDYQRGRFADSALTLRRLQVLLQPDTTVARAVKKQISMAEARAAGKTQDQALAMLQSQTPAPASSASSDAAARASRRDRGRAYSGAREPDRRPCAQGRMPATPCTCSRAP